MYFDDSQSHNLQHYCVPEPEEDEDSGDNYASNSTSPPTTCSQGHRSSLVLQTKQGGSICLLCFSNLISNPQSPTVHVSYALSQLSQALSDPPFLRSLLTFHSHLLVSPLVQTLTSFDDDRIARQVVDLVSGLCDSGDPSLAAEFVARLSDRLSSGALAWSRRQVYTLHCLGVLLNCQQSNPFAHIRDKNGLITNLVSGLQLPSEEIRGEILFLLYKVSALHYASEDADGSDLLFSFCPKLVRLSLEALMKTQSDDVRLNCIALLTVLARRGLFGTAYALDLNSMSSSEGDSFGQATEDGKDMHPLNILFTEAIKGPLLSTDSQVQISTLDLLFHYMSCEGTSSREIQVLVEESIADYVFEILRLSECKDPAVKSCLQVLDILSKAEQAFKQRLVVGFAILVPVLHYVAEVPFHPVQNQTLKLILSCISDCPGMLSSSHIEELVPVLTKMLKQHTDGDMGMLEETFIMTCSVLVAIIRTPSFHVSLNLAPSIKESLEYAVLACLSTSNKHPGQLLHSLYLLKEAYMYSHEENSTDSSKIELRNLILSLCTKHLLPWLVTTLSEMEEETILGVLETFHSILLQDSDNQAREFAMTLLSSTWFTLSFGCLGLFPTEKMKWRVYLMLSSLVDVLLGTDTGQPIRDATTYLPSDPIDLLFLLGQRNTHNLELSSCQSAILLILYISSLHDERLADDKMVLASLEQYILVNSSDLQSGATDSFTVMMLLFLYGLYRGLAEVSYQIPYSPEAERILFQIVTENEWDLSSAGIHPISLKWFFQQEKLRNSLSYQLLKFCRRNTSNGSESTAHGKNSHILNVNAIAELIVEEHSYGATILVCLLTELVQTEGQEQEIISVVNLMATIVDIYPTISDQLCFLGIGNAARTLYLIVKLINSITTKAADMWNHECLLVIGILCLILHHSANAVLTEASKTIIFSSSLVSTINSAVHAACLKGPALVDHDEGTSSGEILIFVLLLNYFTLRSLHIVVPGIMDWKVFLDPSGRMQSFSFIGIYCHDLCRLMHFGSPVVKLAASYCLLELFTRISEQRNRTGEELLCATKYLSSVMAVLEGLVFYSDLRVAMNCGLCLSMIMGWELPDMHETSVDAKNTWSRMVAEELAMSLAVPCLASKSFINLHKPAIHVAVALLKLQKIPKWMRSVFDDTCISSIIQNLAANNLSTEIVLLFRALLNSEFLKMEQIASLNQLLQVCRKQKYTDNTKDDVAQEHRVVISNLDDLGQVCEYLIRLMSSESSLDKDSGGSHLGNKRLLEEIELFFRTLTVQDGI
ncbi:protein PUTATIVE RECOMBINATION INITIATION DEFECT 1 isoform X2 [Rosa chinensis]|uniref:protein PUTATIVE RECOMBINATION INITIATION DEFECT 1 isoform X2 n=1 Tax=Rosa chinensis TaxID=74649 RepID=UPI000D08B950|nr:protein PUTATIVE RECOMBINATION INITIATION DEFECT 1 isoform X2 [Rosa chinensis]